MKSTLQCHAHFRHLTSIDDTHNGWNHMVPRGEFPGTIDLPAGYDVPGYGVVKEAMSLECITVLGDEQLESIVQRFKGDMLIDPDHLSHDKEHNTEAMGWGHGIRYMANRADGLEVETEWTLLGKDKIVNRIYRYISPEFAGTVRYEDGVFKFFPIALTGAGLTNRPKLTELRPVSVNRDNAFGKYHRDQISADLERFADVIADQESARVLFQANREAATAFFEAAQKESDPFRPNEVLNRALQISRERRGKGKPCGFELCWDQAKREILTED